MQYIYVLWDTKLTNSQRIVFEQVINPQSVIPYPNEYNHIYDNAIRFVKSFSYPVNFLDKMSEAPHYRLKHNHLQISWRPCEFLNIDHLFMPNVMKITFSG
jgi:hypothetical protein